MRNICIDADRHISLYLSICLSIYKKLRIQNITHTEVLVNLWRWIIKSAKVYTDPSAWEYLYTYAHCIVFNSKTGIDVNSRLAELIMIVVMQ